LKEEGALTRLTSYEQRCLKTIRLLCTQQRTMYEERTHRIPDRIVSISQPHVRPILRGKAGKKVEFGAKVSLSHLKEGYVTLDRLSWDAYNEGADLPTQIENYRARFGHHPASVHADTIYRTRKNFKYCQERGIRFSGKPLGRPKKETEENKETLKAQSRQRRQDEKDRIPVEGKFGNAKRKGTLDRIMAKLIRTSESVIHIGFIVLNLDKWLRQVLFYLQSTGLGGLWVLLRINQSNPIIGHPSWDRPFAPAITRKFL
jgi:IS5 family transposase